jgi:hypothetical protein
MIFLPVTKRDFDSVTHLSALLSRVQQLQKRATELEGEVSEIETILKKMNGKTTSEQVAELVPHLAGNEADESTAPDIDEMVSCDFVRFSIIAPCRGCEPKTVRFFSAGVSSPPVWPPPQQRICFRTYAIRKARLLSTTVA